ncbi:MAG: (deoxy)nucleoside triphosphate pyrophosphohydrolase [Bacteroidetes bacterium]|nr:(deoxy)nucleoside triphosphate pyrophosphohydrolase [Bacteroidota bacterium]
MSTIVKVVAVIIYNEDNRFLMARKKAGKPLAGYWEFPGGKVEAGEDEFVALEREIKEELNLELKDIQFCFQYQYRDHDQTIDFTFFRALIDSGKMVLTDHDEIVWINEWETKKYKIAPGDVEALVRLTSQKNK